MKTSLREKRAGLGFSEGIEDIVNAEKITWDNGWVNITADHRKQWKRAYPGVNIQVELEAMNQWL